MREVALDVARAARPRRAAGGRGGERHVAQVGAGERHRRGRASGGLAAARTARRPAPGSAARPPVPAARSPRSRSARAGRRSPTSGPRGTSGRPVAVLRDRRCARHVAGADRRHARPFAPGAAGRRAPHDRARAGGVARAVAREHHARRALAGQALSVAGGDHCAASCCERTTSAVAPCAPAVRRARPRRRARTRRRAWTRASTCWMAGGGDASEVSGGERRAQEAHGPLPGGLRRGPRRRSPGGWCR